MCNRVGKTFPTRRTGGIFPLHGSAQSSREEPSSPTRAPDTRQRMLTFFLWVSVCIKGSHPVNRTRALRSLYHLITAYSVLISTLQCRHQKTFIHAPSNAGKCVSTYSALQRIRSGSNHLLPHHDRQNLSACNSGVIFDKPILAPAPTLDIPERPSLLSIRPSREIGHFALPYTNLTDHDA